MQAIHTRTILYTHTHTHTLYTYIYKYIYLFIYIYAHTDVGLHNSIICMQTSKPGSKTNRPSR